MPFRIPVAATGFGAAFQSPPAGNLLPQFRNRDLVRAAIMAGHPNGAGNAPDPLIRAWRLATIKLAVQHNFQNRLIHPRAWNRLDPTEKGQIRNLLGNTITKLLCERLLHAPLMVFVDVYGALYGYRYRGARPDYIAQTLHRAWFTIEAKGRDRMAKQNKLEAIKNRQAATNPVAQPSALRAHVVSWIGQRRNNVAAVIHDPEPRDDLNRLPLKTAGLVETYYAPVLRILEKDRSWVNSADDQMIPIEGADCRIGLHPKVAALLRANQHELVAETLKFLNGDGPDSSQLATEDYAPDGIRLVTGESWPKEANN
jgi:hypothetical protein